jgi:outer membrane protein
MPQYQAMQKNLKAMKEQYEAEAKKSENDFQRKFEEFMNGQKEFPKTILEKRQNELQNMLESNASFRIKVQALLKEAEESMMADVRAELDDAITIAAQERGISIVFDLDGGSVPYIVPGLATDLTADVIKLLGLEETIR